MMCWRQRSARWGTVASDHSGSSMTRCSAARLAGDGYSEGTALPLSPGAGCCILLRVHFSFRRSKGKISSESPLQFPAGLPAKEKGKFRKRPALTAVRSHCSPVMHLAPALCPPALLGLEALQQSNYYSALSYTHLCTKRSLGTT